jgi:hypothetical protein
VLQVEQEIAQAAIVSPPNLGGNILQSSSGPNRCVRGQYGIIGHWVSGTMQWYYNPQGAPSGYTTAQYVNRINNAASTWVTGANNCGGLTHAPIWRQYMGETSTATGINSSAQCITNYGVRAVGWGNFGTASNIVALTCSWSLNQIVTNNSMEFSKAYSWYAGDSTSGCSGAKYDLGGVAAHEMGHVWGLADVATGSDQVMDAQVSYCDTGNRLLGISDLEGIIAKYGTAT